MFMLPKLTDVFFIKVLIIFYLSSFIYCGSTAVSSAYQEFQINLPAPLPRVAHYWTR